MRLKGGDPFVFGRGGGEALARAGIPFEIVPGVSSLTAVPAAAGIPVTQRGSASMVTAFAAHDPDTLDVDALARLPGTLVGFMGLAGLARLAERLVAAGKHAAAPAAAISCGTTTRQRSVLAPLGAIAQAAAGLETPARVMIGDVVAVGQELALLRQAAA